MALKSILKQIDNARRAYEETVKSVGQEQLVKGLQELIPDGFKLEWTQYTPYFNDGDACVFGVNDCYLYTTEGINWDKEEIDEDDFDPYDLPPSHCYNKNGEPKQYAKFFAAQPQVKEKNVTELFKLFAAIPEPVMEECFGDHAKVVLTKTTCDVNSYEHE